MAEMQSHAVSGHNVRVIVDEDEHPMFIGTGMDGIKLATRVLPPHVVLGKYGRGLWVDNGVGWGFVSYPMFGGVCYHRGVHGCIIVPSVAPCASLMAGRLVVGHPPWGLFSGTGACAEVFNVSDGRVEHKLQFGRDVFSVFRIMSRRDNVVWFGFGDGVIRAYDLYTLSNRYHFQHELGTGLYDTLISEDGATLAVTTLFEGLSIYDTRTSRAWMSATKARVIGDTILAITDWDVCVRDDEECVAIDRRTNQVRLRVAVDPSVRSVVWDGITRDFVL